jgi:very-short-patch-repair endonuclease
MKRSREHQPERIEFARSQRRQANKFSQTVWQMIRAGRMLGEKFRREFPLGPYTLDFVCIDLKLNIEVDGKDLRTEEGRKHDADRDDYLRKLGYTILRFNGFRIPQDPSSIRTEIESCVRQLREPGDLIATIAMRFSAAKLKTSSRSTRIVLPASIAKQRPPA